MTLITFLKKKQNLKIFIFLLAFFSFLYFLFENLSTSFNTLFLPLFSVSEKINIFLISLFDVSILKNPAMLILVVLMKNI